MAPWPTGTACLARPRMRNSRAPSATERAPAAHSAEYSPREWPATSLTPSARVKPCSKYTHDSHRDGEERRLRILRQRQGLDGTLEHDPGQLLPQRQFDFVERVPRCSMSLGKVGAHADRLAALPRKYQCDGHSAPTSLPAPARLSHSVPPSSRLRPQLRRRRACPPLPAALGAIRRETSSQSPEGDGERVRVGGTRTPTSQRPFLRSANM